MRYVDLRSDTVTQPTQKMRDAMYSAQVGDDVFGDDPTINSLEKLAAETLGKEAALFVPSGTQGNELAVMTHTRRGDAIIIGRGYHIVDHEAGAYALLSAVSPCYVRDNGGVLDPEAVREALIDDSELQIARTGLVCLENALSNGCVVPADNLKTIYGLAHEKGVPVHLDGARLFNAALVNGVGVKEMARYCDSVMCCLSKGLCAPVGSILAGTAEFIAKARKNRKLLGGGMRQAGFLAAAGILALTEMPARLEQDHENARYLGEALAELPGVTVAMDRLQINMVFFTVDWDDALVAALPAEMLARGFKICGREGGQLRFVTNKDVTREDCGAVVKAMRDILEKSKAAR